MAAGKGKMPKTKVKGPSKFKEPYGKATYGQRQGHNDRNAMKKGSVAQKKANMNSKIGYKRLKAKPMKKISSK